MPPPRKDAGWIVRSLVDLTCLACLFTAVYASQVPRSKSVALAWDRDGADHRLIYHATPHECLNSEDGGYIEYIDAWSQIAWYGAWDSRYGYQPKRCRHEYLKLVTGADTPNDPQAWRDYLNSHVASLDWDGKKRRFVIHPKP